MSIALREVFNQLSQNSELLLLPDNLLRLGLILQLLNLILALHNFILNLLLRLVLDNAFRHLLAFLFEPTQFLLLVKLLLHLNKLLSRLVDLLLYLGGLLHMVHLRIRHLNELSLLLQELVLDQPDLLHYILYPRRPVCSKIVKGKEFILSRN